MLSDWLIGTVTTETLFTELAIAGLIVIFAGWRFSILADRLGKRLNLGGGWVGLILLATVTSLPEVVAGGTATALGNTNMAFAAVLGSCCFNVTIIVILNAIMRGGSVLRNVSSSHTLTSSFGLLLTAIALFGVVMAERLAHDTVSGQIFEAAWALLIVVSYLGCMRLIYQFERARAVSAGQERTRNRVGRGLTAQLVVIACILVAAAWWLACLGDVLSTHHIELIGRPLGATFVGAGLLALATSLPEIATSISAVKLGNLDLALGNIFGSNMFNIFVLPMLKVVSLANGDPLLMPAGVFHSDQALMAGLLAILLTAIALGGLAYQSQRKVLRHFGFDSVLIGLTYLGGMYLLFRDAG